MSAVPPRQPRPHGQHFLQPGAAADFIARLTDGSDLGLVVDIGAGIGALTTLLAERAERVVAIEADRRLAARLAHRTAACTNVTVIAGNVLDRPLPQRPFRIVANLPFAGSTAILRYVLGSGGASPLLRADVIVQLGAARGWTAGIPSRADAVTWYPWFELELTRRIPARSFRPIPSVDAGALTIVRRTAPLLPARHHDAFSRFVAKGFRSRCVADVVGAAAGRKAVRPVCRAAGVSPAAPPSAVAAPAWVSLFATSRQRAYSDW